MPKASHGYGGKFGLQQDRMDKVRGTTRLTDELLDEAGTDLFFCFHIHVFKERCPRFIAALPDEVVMVQKRVAVLELSSADESQCQSQGQE